MTRILLLDCSAGLGLKLKSQGFDVESGTTGFCTGLRKLPSQVYEKDVFFFDPSSIPAKPSAGKAILVEPGKILDGTPEYSLKHLQTRIESGGTFVVFLNRVSQDLSEVQKLYGWIPFMPPVTFTSDRLVTVCPFDAYQYDKWKMLLPIIRADQLDLPVLLKVDPPEPDQYRTDVFYLFWNANGDVLGVVIVRGRGQIIILPKYRSNDAVIEEFLHRVLPNLYQTTARAGLVEMFVSSEQAEAEKRVSKLQSMEKDIGGAIIAAKSELSTVTRKKAVTIKADATATQVLIYYDQARKEPRVALFYLYKVVEAIENKFGGEAVGISAVGVGNEWKAVKRLANETYRDARHAPKPTDVIKPWTNEEIKRCFEDTEKVIMAYFATLFPSTPRG